MSCTRPALVVAVGDPCPDCGHTSLVHPGPANPSLVECAICQVQSTVGQLRVDVDLVTDAVAELVPLDPELVELAPAPTYDQVTS